MITKSLQDSGFDFSLAPTDVRESIEVLKKNTDGKLVSDNQKMNLLDYNIFLSLESLFPNDPAIKITRESIDAKDALVANDSFNTTIDETFVPTFQETIEAVDQEHNEISYDIPIELYFKNKVDSDIRTNEYLFEEAANYDGGVNELIEKLPTEIIPIEKIVPTQTGLHSCKMDSITGEITDIPLLCKHDDMYYVEDGHHRIATWVKNGEPIQGKPFPYQRKIFDSEFGIGGGIENKKLKILYLHGLGATTESDHVKVLYDDSIHIIAPSFNYEKEPLFNHICEIIENAKPDGIVGHSMGGYLAYHLSNKYKIPALLFNPAFEPKDFKLQPIPDEVKKLEPFDKQIAVVGSKDGDVPKEDQLKVLDKNRCRIFIEKIDHTIPDEIKVKYFRKFVEELNPENKMEPNSEQNKLFIVHTQFPHDEGNGILGYVNSIEEFDEFVNDTYSKEKSSEKFSIGLMSFDEFGRGSKSYWIEDNHYSRIKNNFEIICEPIGKIKPVKRLLSSGMPILEHGGLTQENLDTMTDKKGLKKLSAPSLLNPASARKILREMHEKKSEMHSGGSIHDRAKERYDGNDVPKSKFNVGDMVFSWQNPDYAARVSFKRFEQWNANGKPHENDSWEYKVTLVDKEGYIRSSKLMGEDSLHETQQNEY